MKQTIIKTTFLFFILISFFNCEKEEVITDQQINIETVSINEAHDLFSQSSKTSKSSKTNNNQFAIPQLDKISQEEIINSNELLTLIPATTFEGVDSRILLIKINGETKSVVFSMIKDENIDTPEFSGMIYIHTLKKEYINTLKVENGIIVSRFEKPEESDSSKSHFAKGDEDCWGIACGMHGDEVIIIAKKQQTIEFTYIFREGGGGYGEGDTSWNYGEDPQGASGGGSGVQQVAETSCDPGYVKDSNGICVLEEVFTIDLTNTKKIDPTEELKCFDLTQEAKLTVYVQQPKENSNQLVGPNEVGHAFVGIEQNGIVRQFGYYPETGANTFSVVLGKTYKAEIRGNYNYLYHVSISKNISSSELKSIIDYTKDFPEKYNLNEYACADFAIAAGNLGGMNLPSTTISNLGFNGRTPAELGQEIRAMNSDGTKTINSTKSNSPERTGDCD